WKRLLHVVICMVKTVNIVDTDDVNEGFASGQDEPFETDTNTLLALVKDSNVKDDVGEMFFEAKPDLDDDKVVENEKVGSENLVKVAENDELESKILDEVVESDKLGENLSESKGDEVVVENGVKVTNEGDSVVEDIKVDVAMVDPGVAVVIKNPDELSLADPVAMSHVRDEIAPSILLVVDFGGWYRVDSKASNGRASAARDGWEKPDGGMSGLTYKNNHLNHVFTARTLKQFDVKRHS
ncbi:hypothetical protein Tco_1089829, partial [Tanacetum coccineum]